MKECSKCRRMLDDDAFYRDNDKKSGLSSQCKGCTGDRLGLRRWQGLDRMGVPLRWDSNQTVLRRWLRDRYRVPADLRLNVPKLLGLTTAEARAPHPSRYEIRRSLEQVENDIDALLEQYEREKLGILRGEFVIEN